MNTPVSHKPISRRPLLANALLAIALLLCVCISGASAQFRFAVQGGVNYANLAPESNLHSSDDHLTGFVAGAKVEYQLTEAGFVYLGAQYAQKGDATKWVSRDKMGNELSYYYGEDRYEYLEFPAGLKYAFLERGFRPYVFGGMALAVLLSATSEVDSPYLGFTSTDITDGRNKTDVLFHLGAGAELALTEFLAAFIDVRYSRSIRNMYIEHDDDHPHNATLYTSDVMLIVGVSWE